MTVGNLKAQPAKRLRKGSKPTRVVSGQETTSASTSKRETSRNLLKNLHPNLTR